MIDQTIEEARAAYEAASLALAPLDAQVLCTRPIPFGEDLQSTPNDVADAWALALTKRDDTVRELHWATLRRYGLL